MKETDRLVASWLPPASLMELAGEDAQFIADLIDAFQMDTRRRLRHIRSALDAGDAATLGAEAHAIKGSARQIGATAVAELCMKLETESCQFSLKQLEESIGVLESRFGEADGAMTSYLAIQRQAAGL